MVRRRALVIGCISALIALAASCADSVSPKQQIVLRNATTDSIPYYADELGASALREVPAGPVSDTIFRSVTVAPGNQLVVRQETIEGYFAGASVRFYVYRIRNGQALWRGQITVTDAELRAMQSVVTVTPSTLTQFGSRSALSVNTDVFTSLDTSAVVGALARSSLMRLRKRQWVRGVQIVKLAGDATGLLVAGPVIAIPIGRGRHIVLRGSRVTKRMAGVFSWYGSAEGGGFGSADLVSTTMVLLAQCDLTAEVSTSSHLAVD